MAAISLRRCLNGRDHVIVLYNDETQALDFQYTLVDGDYKSWYIKERMCGQVYASDVPEWLGKREMQQNPVLDGTTLYLQKLGSVLYRVTSDSRDPYANVEQEAWTDFSATEEHTDETSYQAKDGTAKVTLSGGSGYFVMSLGNNGGPWVEPQTEFNNLSPNESLIVYYKDQLTGIQQMIQVDIVAAAPGTEPPAQSMVEILGVEPKLTSTFGGNDGEVTILATGAESLQYSVNNGAWQSGNQFTGLSMGYVFLQARDSANTSHVAKLNYYLANEDVINLTVSNGANPSCYGRADGVVFVSVGPHKMSEYSFLWSDGSTKAGRRDLAAGDYTLEVTSLRSGNKKVQEITVFPGIGPWPVGIEVERNNVYVDPQGQSLWYEWSDGITEGSRENLPDGEYTLKIGGNLLKKDCYETYYFLIDSGRHFFSDNVVPMSVQVQNAEIKKNLKVIGAVYLEKEYLSDDFQRVGPTNMELPADSSGKAIFKIESILRGYLTPDVPKLTDIGFKRLEGHFKRFYMGHEEKYGDPPTIYDLTIVQKRYVVLGGLNKTEYAVDDFFDVYLPNNRPFYTWQPKTKQVYTDQPEWLTFIINEYDIEQIRLRIRLTYVNGVVREDTLEVYEAPNRYELFRIPVGYSQLQLASYEATGKISYYEILVEDNYNIPMTETRTYTVNRGTEARRYFVYLNSLGGFDTLAAVGKISSRLRVSTDEFERELPHDHPLTESEIYTLRKEGQQVTNVPVGYPGQEMLKAFQDFALSEMVYLLQGNRMIPISTDAEPVTEDEMEGLIGFEFDYSLPKDRKFTPDLSVFKPIAGEPLTINLVSTSQVTTGGNGAIEIAVVDGTPPYTFLWSNGATSQNVQNLEVGEYSVSVVDSSIPVRYGRLIGIPVTEPLLQTIDYYGAGGFEEWDTATFKQYYEYYHPEVEILEISTEVARSGTKSLKLGTKPGASFYPNGGLPELRYDSPGYVQPTLIRADGRWKLSAWVYIPSDCVLLIQPIRTYVDYTQMIITCETASGSYTTQTPVVTADPNIRDQWQYMETIIEVSEDWPELYTESGYDFDFGFKRNDTDSAWNSFFTDQTFYYIDDLTFGIAP